MENTELRGLLRKTAIETVHESTEMLKQAFALFKAGRPQQAEKLQKEARAKRNDSVWLMHKANRLDNDSE